MIAPMVYLLLVNCAAPALVGLALLVVSVVLTRALVGSWNFKSWD